MSANSRQASWGIVQIVLASDGELVGKTRLQKTAYLLTLAGLVDQFPFEYGNYGPYSERLSYAVDEARAFFKFKEERRRAEWGGRYSVFTSDEKFDSEVEEAYTAIVSLAKDAKPITLELASTAAFLANEGNQNPWEETARRKPEKARHRMQGAKEFYARFKKIETPGNLPDI